MKNKKTTIYIFGYGSLMNPQSRAITLPGKRNFKRAVLPEYRRKINAPVNGFLYLNIVKSNGGEVEGVLLSISEQELEKLQEREVGYNRLDVTVYFKDDVDGKVFVFIAPDVSYPALQVPLSYLHTCLGNVPRSKREIWLKETLIENEIYDDLDQPVYVNAALSKRKKPAL